MEKPAYMPSRTDTRKMLLFIVVFLLFTVLNWLIHCEGDRTTATMLQYRIPYKPSLTRSPSVNTLSIAKAPPPAAPRAPIHWVVFSTNDNPMYSFFVPLTSWAWTKRIGWRPLVLVSEGVQPLVRDAVRWAGGEVLEVPRAGWPTSTLMQVARIVSAAALEHDEDILTTSDADIFPLDAVYFNTINMSEADVHVQGSHSATLHKKQYPICYVTMTVGTWKRVMNISSNRNLSVAMAPFLRKKLNWDYDQVLLYKNSQAPGVRVKLYGGWRFQGRMDFRVHPTGLAFKEGAYLDSHLLRPGFTQGNWPELRRALLDHIMDNKTLEHFERYRRVFIDTVMNGDELAKGVRDGMGRPKKRRV